MYFHIQLRYLLINKEKFRKIHTGFNGPATGAKYQEFQKEFNQFIEQLTQE